MQAAALGGRGGCALIESFEAGHQEDELLVKRVMRENPMASNFIDDLWRKGTLQKATRHSLGDKAFETPLGNNFGPKV